MTLISVPDYYPQFQCIGPQCEDTCCSGWTVNVDRTTYQRYEQSTHEVLAPMFKLAIYKNTTLSGDQDKNFGLMRMKPDGSCHFQQADKLCAIQRTLGAQALSDTCSLYPRYINLFGGQRESALGISCPEAARLILLNPAPMQFSLVEPMPGIDDRACTTFRFPEMSDGDPVQISVLNDLRALIIAILQCRALSLGARLMTLGFLLQEADHITSSAQFTHASELQPVLGAFVDLLAQPAQLEAQFAQIEPQIPRKLDLITGMIAKSLTVGASPRFSECLQLAALGLAVNPGGDLLRHYSESYQTFYQPFIQERGHIFENYLVNNVIVRLFPFTRGSYLDLYRELVFNLSILQVLLVGMATQHKGLDERLVIQLFQSFARKSDHSKGYQQTLLDSLDATDQNSFTHVMWLLKETTPT